MADRDHRIQNWKTKLEVAELEKNMVEVKKDQAVEALRGREVSRPKTTLKFILKIMSRIIKIHVKASNN